MGTEHSWARMGPASNSSFMRWAVTPRFGSPLRIAHSTGAGPRYSGSIEQWTLTTPWRGIERTAGGSRQEKPKQTTRSRA
jgi:hypothetical protein